MHSAIFMYAMSVCHTPEQYRNSCTNQAVLRRRCFRRISYTRLWGNTGIFENDGTSQTLNIARFSAFSARRVDSGKSLRLSSVIASWSHWALVNTAVARIVKPRPHRQQCRSNVVECYKSNDSVDKVERCFDVVAVWQQCRTSFFREISSFRLSRNKLRTFVEATVDFVERIFRLVAFYNVASTLLLMWTELKTCWVNSRSLWEERTFCISVAGWYRLDDRTAA